MYKIIAVVPNKEIQTPEKFGDLSQIEIEGTATVIVTAREDDAALRLILGFCKRIASGTTKSLTITKDDNNHKQTEV